MWQPCKTVIKVIRPASLLTAFSLVGLLCRHDQI